MQLSFQVDTTKQVVIFTEKRIKDLSFIKQT